MKRGRGGHIVVVSAAVAAFAFACRDHGAPIPTSGQAPGASAPTVVASASRAPAIPSGADCLAGFRYFVSVFANPWPEPCSPTSLPRGRNPGLWIRAINEAEPINDAGPTIGFTLYRPDGATVLVRTALNYFTVAPCMPGHQCPSGWSHSHIDLPAGALDLPGDYTLASSSADVRGLAFHVAD
jgi:hypothetical protein